MSQPQPVFDKPEQLQQIQSGLVKGESDHRRV